MQPVGYIHALALLEAAEYCMHQISLCGHESLLTKNRLNLHQKGEAKFPIEQIKALKLLYEIYAPLMGVSELVSPNAAIKSLESYGYNLEGLKKVDYETTD